MSNFFIFGAKYLYLLSVVIGLIWILTFERPNRKIVFLFSMASLALTLIIGKLGNYFIYNPRPFVLNNFKPLIEHAADNGFPSDHTLLVASIAAIVTFYNKKVGSILWTIALVVGYSRIYTGVHHSVDVLGSILIAVFSSTVVYYLIKQRRMI